MERGDLDGAERAFKKNLAASPDDLVAKIGLAQVNLVRRKIGLAQVNLSAESPPTTRLAPAGTQPSTETTPGRSAG